MLICQLHEIIEIGLTKEGGVPFKFSTKSIESIFMAAFW
jgi:hypothetical protein